MARLFVSKMKSEAKNLVSRAATLEQQQAEANRKTEEMEKELSESRLTIVQVGLKSVFFSSVADQDSGSGAFVTPPLERKIILDQDPGSANYISKNLVPMFWVKDT